MAVLKYLDPVSGDYLPVSYGGGSTSTNEVTVSLTQPTDGSELWLDEGATAASEDYVNVTGDAMAGPLVVQTPTAMTHAARWADGTPRFADAAARDAAYAGIGGPVEGMKCWLLDIHQEQTHLGASGWAPTGGVLPSIYAGLPQILPAEAGWNFLPVGDVYIYQMLGGFTVTGDGGLQFNVSGYYMLSYFVTFSSLTGPISLGMLGISPDAVTIPNTASTRFANEAGTDLRGMIGYPVSVTAGEKQYYWGYGLPAGLAISGELFLRYLGPAIY